MRRLSQEEVHKAVEEIMEKHGQDGTVEVHMVEGEALASYFKDEDAEHPLYIYREADLAKLLEERNG
jgi:hypothetical protein